MKFANLICILSVFFVASFSVFASESEVPEGELKASSLVTVLDARGNETEIDRNVLIAMGLEGFLRDRFSIQADIIWSGRTMAASNVRYIMGDELVGIRYYRETSTFNFQSWASERVSLSICRALGFSKSANEMVIAAVQLKYKNGNNAFSLASPAAILHDNLSFNKLQIKDAHLPYEALGKALDSFVCL
jgi:hypothetical protein